MKFGPQHLRQALGGVLAHSVPTPAGRLRKGRILSAEDIDALAQAGRTDVTVAMLDPSDMGEDAAAARLAEALVPDPARAGLRLGTAATGRVNVYATGPGVIGIDAARIHAVNHVDPMITIATLPPLTRVEADTMVATVKIIAFAVPEQALTEACAAATQALQMHPPRLRRVALIETTVGGPLSDKGTRVTQDRLTRLDADLTHVRTCAHDTSALATALAEVQGEVDLVLILTASATSDPADTAPSALRAAGGQVTYVGMPVDPGNLLFFGTLMDTPVIGLPGCARSPALNGADWVMERIICGLPVTPQDIAGMGVGGLLKEIPTRPQPRDRRT